MDEKRKRGYRGTRKKGTERKKGERERKRDGDDEVNNKNISHTYNASVIQPTHCDTQN